MMGWRYLVGVSTSANIPYGSAASFCKMGIANATVFPDPVFAFPMQSLPYVQVNIFVDFD